MPNIFDETAPINWDQWKKWWAEIEATRYSTERPNVSFDIETPQQRIPIRREEDRIYYSFSPSLRELSDTLRPKRKKEPEFTCEDDGSEENLDE